MAVAVGCFHFNATSTALQRFNVFFGIVASLRIGRDIHCLTYAGVFIIDSEVYRQGIKKKKKKIRTQKFDNEKLSMYVLHLPQNTNKD